MLSTNPVLRYMLGAAALVVIVAGIKAAQAAMVPLLLSLFIAVLCGPVLFWLTSRKVPTALAITLIIIGVSGVLAVLSSVVSGSVNQFISDLPFYQTRLSALNSQFLTWAETTLAGFGVEFSGDRIRDMVNPSQLLGMVGTTLNSFGNIMTNLLLILVTVIFILSEMHSWKSKLLFIDRNGGSGKLSQSFARVGETVVHYMTLKLWVSMATGLFIAVWLWAIGVDYFVLWALVAFLLNFIPNIGSILAAIPAVLLAVVQLGVPEAAFTALGYVVVNMVMGNVVEPRIMGKGLNLSPLVVFLSLILWGWILGPVGMFLSVPLTMALKIAFENFPETRSLAIMIGGAIPDDELNPMSDEELSDAARKHDTGGSEADSDADFDIKG